MSSPDTARVARRRSAAPHTSMFLRMLVRAAVLRRGRAASALLAMVVAAAVATAMLNLYVDVQAKLRTRVSQLRRQCGSGRQRRPASAGGYTGEGSVALGPQRLAVPFAYAVARTTDGHSVVVAGTDFDQVQKLNALVVGNRLAERLARCAAWRPRCRRCGHTGKPFDLSFQGRKLRFNPAGTLQTGAAEDSRIYLSLADFAEWTGVPIRRSRSQLQALRKK